MEELEGLYCTQRVEEQVAKAIDVVRKLLHVNRTPRIASKVHHQYDDKYMLVDFLVNTAVASQLNGLVRLGLTRPHLERMRDWAKHRSVSVKVSGLTTCSFLREETREIESISDKHITDVTTSDGVGDRHVETQYKTLTKVTDYFWKHDVHYEVVAYSGTGDDPAETIRMLERKGSRELKCPYKDPPRPESSVISGLELEFSWLLSNLDPDTYAPSFIIDRKADACKTPCRNTQVEAALKYFGTSFALWADGVQKLMVQQLGQECEKGDARSCGSDLATKIFNPVVPLFEKTTKDQEGEGDDTVARNLLAVTVPDTRRGEDRVTLAAGDANRFLEEEWRMLEEMSSSFEKTYGLDLGIFTAVEATVSLTLAHARNVAQQLRQGIAFVEDMLRTTLVKAIGQQLTPGDLTQFMRFHNRKLFLASFEPQPFSYAIRCSGSHAPEGTLSIEERVADGSISQPLTTIVNSSIAAHPMQFSLGASAKVTFTGSRFIHAACLHQFSGMSGASFQLEARSRQFSSMIVLVGRIASATLFEPTHAAIVQNKEELVVPLEMSTIPTAKEFRDAIESLSPEQQAFAKAFRAMQLESTLFGVLVLQIKPQMEKLLGLPQNALMKEVLLTKDLIKLFIDFQISSDLLSFTGDAATTKEVKLNTVKAHVKSMQDVLKQGRQSQLAQFRAEKTKTLRDLEANYKQTKRAERQRVLETEKRSRQRRMSPRMMECAVQERALCCAMEYETMACEMVCDEMVMCKGREMMEMNEVVEPMEVTPDSPNQEDTSADKKENDDAVRNKEEIAKEEFLDYTELPKELDRKFQELDEDNCLRPTIISPGEVWTKRVKAGLLGGSASISLFAEELKQERNKAFDLLDALTKSGSLPVEHADLHVILAATHCFENSVIETAIQANKNPIEKVEKSTLIMATAIHRKPASELVQGVQLPRIQSMWPALCNVSN